MAVLGTVVVFGFVLLSVLITIGVCLEGATGANIEQLEPGRFV